MQADCLPWERRAPARRPCFLLLSAGLTALVGGGGRLPRPRSLRSLQPGLWPSSRFQRLAFGGMVSTIAVRETLLASGANEGWKNVLNHGLEARATKCAGGKIVLNHGLAARATL